MLWWMTAVVAGYVLWWLLTRFRVYRVIVLLGCLGMVFGAGDSTFSDALPMLAFCGALSVMVFHGRRAVMRLLPWT